MMMIDKTMTVCAMSVIITILYAIDSIISWVRGFLVQVTVGEFEVKVVKLKVVFIMFSVVY